jgi:hypothetical protein
MPLIIINDPVDEKTAFPCSFKIGNADDESSIDLTEINTYLFVDNSGDPPVYINNRDGDNNLGLEYSQNEDGTWSVRLNLGDQDNVIVNPTLYAKSGYEVHILRFEIIFNESDTYYQEYQFRVRNLAGVS